MKTIDGVSRWWAVGSPAARHTAALFVLVSAGIFVRAYLACEHYGFQTGDDVEILESAMRRATGLTHTPWEIRSLFIPEVLVAPIVQIAAHAGVRDPFALAQLARLPFIFLSAIHVLFVYALSSRWYDRSVALTAAALYSVHWMPLVFGSSLYPRTIAVSCILGAAILLHGEVRPRAAILAGLLAALAVTARYSEALYFLSLLVALPNAENRRRRVAYLCAGFAIGCLVFVGLYDRVTGGRWFGSLVAFAELTFVARDASSVTVAQPEWWYVGNMLHWIPATALPLLVVCVRHGDRRRAAAFVLLPLLLLSAIFHKELRYVQVVVPFVVLFAARGFWIWHRRGGAHSALALGLLLLAFPLAIGRIGGVADRSTNAVTAARWMAARHPEVVALSQPWAYGGRVLFGNEVSMIDLDVPPRADSVRHAARDATAVAMYASDATPGTVQTLADAGLSRRRMFQDRGGRAVTVFFR